MTIDPRTPVIVGVAQATWRPDGRAEPLLADATAPEPLEMWATVARRAADDARAPDLLAHLDSVRVVYCQSWPYDDPAGRLCERLGISPRHRHYTGIGGTTPAAELVDAARQIATGQLDAALIVSGEALDTKRRLKKAGERPAWSHRHPQPPPMPFEAPFHDAEVAHEVFQAWLTFALWDVARRAARGDDVDAYRHQVGATMSALSARAATNPHAWFPTAVDATELMEVTADNRMVATPYTKRTVSVMDVDMAAALVVMSTSRADALGVPQGCRVYPVSSARACDPVYVAEHDVCDRSPAMAAAFSAALAGAGTTIEELEHLDLYSCFASSVHFAVDALGLTSADPRGLTVTGGLPYFGGPGSGYLTHAIAEMADVLRGDPGSTGLVTGVGMHMTKHIAVVLSGEPPDDGLVVADTDALQARLDAEHPARPIELAPTGPATIVAYTVVADRHSQPAWALAVCELADGRRAYARVHDVDACAELTSTEGVGHKVVLGNAEGPMGAINLAELA